MTVPSAPAAASSDAVPVPASSVGRTRQLAWYVVLVFAVTWGVAALVLTAPGLVRALGGEFSAYHPLYFLAVYAPSLVGVALTARFAGRAGLADLGSRLLRWRVRPRYWVAVLVGIPVLDGLARVVQRLVTGEPAPGMLLDGVVATTVQNWYLAPALLLLTLLLDAGPLGEEAGWRGFALPRLLGGRLGPLGASVLLGVVWGTWHLPAFAVAGTHQHDQAMGVLWLVVGTTLVSVLMTWLYLRTAGSVLLAGVAVHLMVNSTGAELWAFDLVLVLPAAIAAWDLHRRDLPLDPALTRL